MTTATIKSEYAINAMRTAIVNQSLNGTNHAITKAEAVASGTTEERWKQWCDWVDDLRMHASHYGELQGDSKVDDKSKLMKSAEGKVWSAWRSILKVGEENLFHKNMFVRRSDVEKITTFACNLTYVYVEGKGKVPSITSKTNFRKFVEMFLAARIAGNKMLSDEQRDIIKAYNSAKNTVATLTKALNGEGDEVGMKKDLELKREALESVVSALKVANIDEEQIEAITAVQAGVIKALESQIEDAEKSIKNAKSTIDEKQAEYDEIVGLLDAIEAPVDGPVEKSAESCY